MVPDSLHAEGQVHQAPQQDDALLGGQLPVLAVRQLQGRLLKRRFACEAEALSHCGQ